MTTFGKAWLLDRDSNYIDVYAHPSESFEFDSVVDIVEQYGSKLDKWNCKEYRSNPTTELKQAILYTYNQNWCKVRLWWDNKLTFRIASTDFNWYKPIIDFLLTCPFAKYSTITVENTAGKIYWDNISYEDSIDPANEAILSDCFIDSELIVL